MRLFLDECLSPTIALELAEEYNHYTVHPRNNGGLGYEDHQTVSRCIQEDLVIVTADAKDFGIIRKGRVTSRSDSPAMSPKKFK